MPVQPSRQAVEIVYSDDPGARCPGGQPLADCETVQGRIEEAKAWAAQESFTIDGIIWEVPLKKGINCLACLNHCQVEIQIEDRQPTESMRFEFSDYRP